MDSSTIEDLVRQSFEDFYKQRLIQITKVTLSDLLRNRNLYLLCATNGSSVSKIVEKMLTEYISSSDENIFGQTFLESIASIESKETIFSGKKSNGAYKTITLMNFMRDYSTHNQREFNKEWAKALNRFEHDFLNNFGNPDGSIDWEKLLRYNSGKESVPWISKVMPASVEDQVDEEVDDNDDSIESDE